MGEPTEMKDVYKENLRDEVTRWSMGVAAVNFAVTLAISQIGLVDTYLHVSLAMYCVTFAPLVLIHFHLCEAIELPQTAGLHNEPRNFVRAAHIIVLAWSAMAFMLFLAHLSVGVAIIFGVGSVVSLLIYLGVLFWNMEIPDP